VALVKTLKHGCLVSLPRQVVKNQSDRERGYLFLSLPNIIRKLHDEDLHNLYCTPNILNDKGWDGSMSGHFVYIHFTFVPFCLQQFHLHTSATLICIQAEHMVCKILLGKSLVKRPLGDLGIDCRVIVKCIVEKGVNCLDLGWIVSSVGIL
jgi:hypothetical protein